MASNQRRTDDLLRLKTRGLIYQNPDGTYPAVGSVPFMAETDGTVGWSSVTIETNGSMNVPCGLTASDDRFSVDCETGAVDLYTNQSDPRVSSNLNLHGPTTQLRLINGTDMVTGCIEGTVAFTDLAGTPVAPTLTFDETNHDVRITNRAGEDIVIAEDNGDVTVNGNINVVGDFNNAGSLEADYFTLRDLNAPTDVGYVWNQGDKLLWEDNAGNVEPISGWSAALDPTGCVVANPYAVPPEAAVAGPLNPASATIIADLTSVVNLLLNRLNTQNAFLSIANSSYVYPPITFQNAQSITLGWAPVSSTVYTYITIGPISGVQTLNTLVASLNASLGGSPFKISLIIAAKPSVILSCVGPYTYRITDGTGQAPGTAYLFMNHLGININAVASYVNRVFTAASVGNAIAPAGLGQVPPFPPLPLAPIVSVVSVTPTTITITWGGYFDPNVTAFGISNNGNTVVVVSANIQTYTVTGLTTGIPYTLSVYPLSTYDVGPPGSVTRTITVTTLDITTTGFWAPTPQAGPFDPNINILVASVGSGIWTNQLTNLRNTNQIQSISLNYFSGFNVRPAYGSDSRFFAKILQDPTIYYAENQRLAGYTWAIGSPGGPTTPPPGPQTIPGPSNQYYNIFNAAPATGMIDITKTMQFFWWCGFPGQKLSNCNMTGFSVTYVY